MAAGRQSTLVEEMHTALGGIWRLVLGRRDAGYHFDFSQRGLAGSFIAVVLATVILVGFIGMGGAGRGQSPASQLFTLGLLVALRFGALRIVLPRLHALHTFRPLMVASNWTTAIGLMALAGATLVLAFAGALVLGPTSAQTLVSLILLVWAVAALAGIVAEINIYRLIVGLNAVEIAVVIAAQIFALVAGLYLIDLLPI